MNIRFWSLGRLLWCFIVFSLYSVGSSAQSSFDKLNNIIKSADSIRQELPVERIYVQFNKQYFSNVDTIWFKTYLFNQAFMKASEKSGILNIIILIVLGI